MVSNDLMSYSFELRHYESLDDTHLKAVINGENIHDEKSMVIWAVEMRIFISYRLNIMETFRKLSPILVGKSQCVFVYMCE